jgi:hypothetical protein
MVSSLPPFPDAATDRRRTAALPLKNHLKIPTKTITKGARTLFIHPPE